MLIPAQIQFPATVGCESSCCPPPGQGAYTGRKIRITMAAIDPSAAPEADEEGNIPAIPRSTLKIVKASGGEPDSDSDSDDDDALARLLSGGDSDEDSEEEEANGGPSDPSKSKAARQAAAIKKLLAATQEEGSDEEMEDANGAKSKKGKAKASEDDEEEDSEEESGDEDDINLEDYVICTLDTERVSCPSSHQSLLPGPLANSCHCRTSSNPWIS